MTGNSAQIWLITGHSEAGKTSFCRQLVDRAMKMGLNVAGVLSPAVFSGGVKVGIKVEDIHSGEKRLLASVQTEDFDSITPRWKFDADSLNWGSGVLAASIPCDMFVVDELGPMELLNDKGWIEGIRAVHSRQYRLAIVVVRSALLDLAQQRWPEAKVLSIPSSDPAAQSSAGVATIIEDLNR